MLSNSINFHQTFYPNFDYVGKILSIANSGKMLSVDEISRMTGIPTGVSSGKVVPHIKYSKYMSLLKYEVHSGKFILKLTDFGQLVYVEDPFFSEKISRLICHIFLTSPQIGSSLWCFINRMLQHRYGQVISKDVIEHDIYQYFRNTTKLSAYNTAYMNHNSLGNLFLIDSTSDDIRFCSFHYEDEYFYGILYSLFFELKSLDVNRSEYSSVEIFEDLKWNLALNWSEKRALEFLEEASEREWININRQLNPITIVLKRNINELLGQVYSELI
jgi:hypothetical protein